MSCEKKPGAEPIRGYRLLEPLGRGGYGEVWKCEAPGGIHKAIKFVYGNLGSLDGDARQAEEELRAVQRIKSIRHPFLLSMDRVECVNGELVIITELADHNLHDLQKQYRDEGLTGIPRAELLGYLKEAAEVLDLLNIKFDLQHLDVKPANLFLVSNHVKVADFGLVSSLTGATERSVLAGNLEAQPTGKLGAITPLYAAPELFHGKLSRQVDQYSLALAYQELLTGALPFQGKNPRQLLMQHTQEEPDLSSVPAEDRPILARALAKNPEHRYPSCTEMIGALLGQALKPPRPLSSSGVLVSSALQQSVDTTPNKLAETPRPSPKRLPNLPPDTLPGYRFLENLGNTPLLELWKVQEPDGTARLLKFIFGFSLADEQTLKNALGRWRSIQHPGLVETEVVHAEPGRLIVLSDLPRETLRDRFQQCLGQKLPGIHRGELVDYLRAAAEVLDYLYQQHGIQHLGLNPRQLVLDHGWLQINDFGLGQVFWQPGGQDLAQINSRYAAPELYGRQSSHSCDQYSLALIYAEMLSGAFPFKGSTVSQRLEPSLGGLPELDRQVIARALSLDPAARWSSCIEMVMALEGTAPKVEQELRDKPDHFVTLIQRGKPSAYSIQAATEGVDLHGVVAALVASVGGEAAAREMDDVARLSAEGDRLKHAFQVGLPVGAARRKLQGFAKPYQGRIIRDEEQDLAFQIRLPASLWDQLLGRQAGIEVAIHLQRVHALSATPIEVNLNVQTLGTHRKRSIQLLEQVGPTIVDTLRQLLLVNAEKRNQERFLWPHEVTVIPLDPDGRRQERVVCRGKDLSADGMGVYLPHDLNTVDVLLELPDLEGGVVVAVPGALIRAKCCADGWYDVGVLFRLPSVRRSRAEKAVTV